MEFNDKTIKEILVIGILIVFGVLVFFALESIVFSILWGLILAYVFMPVYNKLLPYLKNKSLTASAVMLIALLIVVIPLWFLIPIMIQQVFEIFKFSQTLNIVGFVKGVFPTASSQFVNQVSNALINITSEITTAVMNWLVAFFIDIPYLLINLIVAIFVFFFTLRDSEKLKGFVKSISPLDGAKEKVLVKSFKDITYSVIYGNFIVGIVQGLLAGLGFLIFGIPNTLVLTVLAIFFSILPFAGSFLVWIPIAIYLFATGNTTIAITFVLYNAIIVANVDNVLRAYILSKRTNLSTLFAFISSIGGLYLFGIIGLILGPLIFAYFIILIDMYKEKDILKMFSSNNHKGSQKSESK